MAERIAWGPTMNEYEWIRRQILLVTAHIYPREKWVGGRRKYEKRDTHRGKNGRKEEPSMATRDDDFILIYMRLYPHLHDTDEITESHLRWICFNLEWYYGVNPTTFGTKRTWQNTYALANIDEGSIRGQYTGTKAVVTLQWICSIWRQYTGSETYCLIEGIGCIRGLYMGPAWMM